MSLIQLNKIKKDKFAIAAVISLVIISAVILCFILNNENFYSKPIAKITSISENISQVKTTNGCTEQLKKQQIKAIIMNGKYKGKRIQLENTTSYSQVNDLNLKVNNEVFISIMKNSSGKNVSYQIAGFKRDIYALYIGILFVFLILIIGGFKGFRSLMSLVINIIIFSAAIKLFTNNVNLTLVCITASILFIILSLLIVGGINKKVLSAIIGTMAGTFISMLIAVIVLKMNHWTGVHFEEMELLTHSPEQIFLMEILIGTLGAIMDIAVSISSSINEIYNKNPHAERKTLIKSGMEIGKDIMGTMANTLLFAYMSGSIPMILLILKNNFPISYIININLSLEIVRALVGSIGIVLSIPITIFTSVMLLKNYRIGEL